jgi:hypothetical protein
VAEKGISFCQDPHKITPCSNELAGLPRADGIVFVDAHPSNAINVLRTLNPAVIKEGDPTQIDPALDPFSAKNGFNPIGPSHYSPDFQKKYFKAQADRMNRLIDTALEKTRQMKSGKGPYPDDDVFVMVRSEGHRLKQLDPSIHHTTLKPQKLLKNDGSIVTQVVESVRPVPTDAPAANASFTNGTRIYTVRSFLSAVAIRSTDSMDGIDYCSSNNSNVCALKNISVPVLFSAMSGHYFIRDNEYHYEVAASKDKDYIIVEGATHGITPCTQCEKTPGQYSNTVKNYFDYVAKWLNARY